VGLLATNSFSSVPISVVSAAIDCRTENADSTDFTINPILFYLAILQYTFYKYYLATDGRYIVESDEVERFGIRRVNKIPPIYSPSI
jgi:hypothetical protein